MFFSERTKFYLDFENGKMLQKVFLVLERIALELVAGFLSLKTRRHVIGRHMLKDAPNISDQTKAHDQ